MSSEKKINQLKDRIDVCLVDVDEIEMSSIDRARIIMLLSEAWEELDTLLWETK